MVTVKGSIKSFRRRSIVSSEMRSYHRERIHEGTLFNCHEGLRCVASGRVTRITNMMR
jgi:hypothetical protein